MLRHVQCTFQKLSWLAVVPAAFLGVSCGGEGLTGPSADATLTAALPDAAAMNAALDELEPVEVPASDLEWDPDIDADYPANEDGTMSESCRRRRVKICYKGRTRRVARWKLNWYLRRGATRGPCEQAVTCPCFSVNDIGDAADSCSSQVTSTCSTGDPYYLFLSCDPGGSVPPGVLGVYLSQSADGGFCSRDDIFGSVSQTGLTDAEYQACVKAINNSGYCS